MPSPSQDDVFVDANGCLAERVVIGGEDVIVHYDDEVPESDITTVQGIRCTTALRTAIDMATELTPSELVDMVDQFLGRGLFTVEEALTRVAQPDMVNRRGAILLRQLLVA